MTTPTRTEHVARIGLLMVGVAALLGFLAARTDIFFADGLRYIAQARSIASGRWLDGVVRAIDHPIYPLAIVAAHGFVGGDDPVHWQVSAQLASIAAGILLVIPLYLVSRELYNGRSAWLACLLAYGVPLTGHVLADALSESTFLLFWTWGLWSALKFLKDGDFRWLPLTIVASVLSYLSRPEGLLLPAALVACLALLPILRATRMNWPRWRAAVCILVVGPSLVIGPFIAFKGGIGTKPAIRRLLGTEAKSAADAVERARPLDPRQSTAKTYLLALRAMAEAVRLATTTPLLILALIGLIFSWPPGSKARIWLFLGLIEIACALALIRLHATGGYCSPRHTLVLSFLLILSSAEGLDRLIGSLSIPGNRLGLGEGRFEPGPAVWLLVIVGFAAFYHRETLEPINVGFAGYKTAGRELAKLTPPGTRIVDVTGWSLYYAERPGYTFANLVEAPADPDLRWVVVREAHLRGDWGYCERLRRLTSGLTPVASFPEKPRPSDARVYLFDLRTPRTASAPRFGPIRRR